MAAFDAAAILRFQNNAEDQFATESPCIVDRTSVAIVSGTADYTMPTSVVSIRRVTYLGWKLYPLPHRELRRSFLSGTQQSRPYWYIYNNVGQGKIKLFPVPSSNVAQVSTNLWAGSDILNGFIVEFYRLPDQITNMIPPFIRTPLLTFYSNKRNYAMEGRRIDIKASAYWNAKYETYKNIYTDLLDDLTNKPRKLVASSTAARPYGYLPPPPILPIDRFGLAVDEPY